MAIPFLTPAQPSLVDRKQRKAPPCGNSGLKTQNAKHLSVDGQNLANFEAKTPLPSPYKGTLPTRNENFFAKRCSGLKLTNFPILSTSAWRGLKRTLRGSFKDAPKKNAVEKTRKKSKKSVRKLNDNSAKTQQKFNKNAKREPHTRRGQPNPSAKWPRRYSRALTQIHGRQGVRIFGATSRTEQAVQGTYMAPCSRFFEFLLSLSLLGVFCCFSNFFVVSLQNPPRIRFTIVRPDNDSIV